MEESKRVKVRGTSITVFPWVNGKGRTYWRFAWYDQRGKRRYTTKADRSKAIIAAKDKAREIHNGTLDLGALSDEQASLCRAFLDLEPDWTLIERLRAERARESVTVQTAFDRFIASKEANAGASTRNVSTIKNRLGHLVKEFKERDLSGISVPELDQWLAAGSWEASTKKRIRASLVTFFRWARKQDYLPDQTTAAEKMAVPLVQKKAPAIFTPEELAIMLNAVTLDFLPWLVISAWAGVRREEMYPMPGGKKDGLRWQDIDITGQTITIRREVSKTNERRVIPMTPDLVAALEPIHAGEGPLAGPISPTTSKNGKTAETKLLGSLVGGWRSNALRHSFVTYRCAIVGVGKAAMEAGNSEAETRRSYLNASSEAEAVKWFSLRNLCGTPKKESP